MNAKYEVKHITLGTSQSKGKTVWFITKNGEKVKTKDGAVIYYPSETAANKEIDKLEESMKITENWKAEKDKDSHKYLVVNSKTKKPLRTGSGLVKRFESEVAAKTYADQANKTDYAENFVPVAPDELNEASGMPDYPDLRSDYDQKSIIDGGYVYRKGKVLQLWWKRDKKGSAFPNPERGRETFTLPTVSAAKSAYIHTVNLYKVREEPTLFDTDESDFLKTESYDSSVANEQAIADLLDSLGYHAMSRDVRSGTTTGQRTLEYLNKTKSVNQNKKLKTIISTALKSLNGKTITQKDLDYARSIVRENNEMIPSAAIKYQGSVINNFRLDKPLNKYYAVVYDWESMRSGKLEVLHTTEPSTSEKQAISKAKAWVNKNGRHGKEEEVTESRKSPVYKIVNLDGALKFVEKNSTSKMSETVVKGLLRNGKVVKLKSKLNGDSYEVYKTYSNSRLDSYAINRLPVEVKEATYKTGSPIKTQQEFLKRLKNPSSLSADQNAYRIAVDQNQDTWVPASFGDEKPFKTKSGKTLQYLFNPKQHKHAYYDVGADMILDDDEAMSYINGPIDYDKSLDGTQARKLTTSTGWNLVQQGKQVPVSYYGAIGNLYKKDKNWYVFAPGKV